VEGIRHALVSAVRVGSVPPTVAKLSSLQSSTWAHVSLGMDKMETPLVGLLDCRQRSGATTMCATLMD
jgi:hypothetical protein